MHFCPASIKHKAVPNLTILWFPIHLVFKQGFDFPLPILRNSLLAHFHLPATTITAGQPSNLSTQFPLYCDNGVARTRTWAKTLESLIQANCMNTQWWQCACANYFTANQFIRSTQPVCSSFKSSSVVSKCSTFRSSTAETAGWHLLFSQCSLKRQQRL